MKVKTFRCNVEIFGILNFENFPKGRKGLFEVTRVN